MAGKLSGSVTALFQSTFRSGSNARNQGNQGNQGTQPVEKTQSRGHGVWARLKSAKKFCVAVSLARDRQHFFGRIAGFAAGTLPRFHEFKSRKCQVSCALSSFEVSPFFLC